MNIIKAVRSRSRYSYPAVGLKHAADDPVHMSFRSTMDLDRFHYRRFRSISHRAIGAYLSVVYWGHYSGTAGIIRPKRALSKLKMAKKQKSYPNSAQILRRARSRLRIGRIAEAIRILTDLPQVGFAFASKLCAFIAPEKCGVIDSVVVSAYPIFGFALDPRGYVINNSRNAIQYEKYCRFLQKKAKSFNGYGLRCRWRDRSGKLVRWRALDVERAMYS